MYFYSYLVPFESLATACRPYFSNIFIFLQHISVFTFRNASKSTPPRFLGVFIFFSVYKHLSTSCCAAWTLSHEFSTPTLHAPCFAYPCSYMLLSNVMLSMYFMHTLLGNTSLSRKTPGIFFSQLSPISIFFLLRSGVIQLIQSPPDGMIFVFLRLHFLGMLLFRVFATFGFLVLYLILLIAKVLSVFLPTHSCPSTHLKHLQTYILALSADTTNSLPFNFVNFDVDTYDVAFDNCTSYCVTNNKTDYIFNDYVTSNPGTTPIQGFGGLSPLLVLALLPGVFEMTKTYCIL